MAKKFKFDFFFGIQKRLKKSNLIFLNQKPYQKIQISLFTDPHLTIFFLFFP